MTAYCLRAAKLALVLERLEVEKVPLISIYDQDIESEKDNKEKIWVFSVQFPVGLDE